MKPSTKKTVIIVLAVMAVAAIVYFAFLRKKSAESIIKSLIIDDATKTALLNQLAIVKTMPEATIRQKAQEKGRTYEKQLVAEAAYQLAELQTIDANTYSSIIAQL